MQLQAEFYQLDHGTGDTAGLAVLQRQRGTALQAIAMLMNVYGIIELKLAAEVLFVFPEYKVTMFHVPDIDTPDVLRASAAFIVPSVLKPLMVAWGISQVTIEYTQEDLRQLRDHMKSLVTGKPEEARFDGLPLKHVVDPTAVAPEEFVLPRIERE